MTDQPEGTRSRPHVTAYTRVTGDGLRLWLTSPAVDAPLSVELVPAQILRDRCAKLGDDLARVAAVYRGYRSVPVEAAGDSLTDLAGVGRTFLFDVLRDPQDDPGRLSQFLRQACPSWRIRSAAAPLIHAVARGDHYFPWELLPLFDPFAVFRVRDQPGLERAALAFPGFCAIVERADPEHPLRNPYLDGWDRLPVRVVYDGSYSGAQEEVGFFRGKGEYFRLKGPYPADVDDERAPTLAQQLCDPELGVDGERDGPADQILHFACHCEATAGDTDTFAYRLGDDRHRHKMILLKELKSDLVRYWGIRHGRTDGRPVPDKPLVFLNACGTAVMDPASAVSLLQPFQSNRNRGIIGTAANVPDRTAAELSRRFYLRLLTGSTVGQALHDAKWRLLQDRGNPLGLLYCIHANAGMRVEPMFAGARPEPGGQP